MTTLLPIGLGHLQRFLMPKTTGEANEHLERLRETASLLEVGCRYFRARIPKMWTSDQEKPAAGTGQAV